MNTDLAAQQLAAGFGGQIFGAMTLSGLALSAAAALFMGIRGSDRIKINTRDRAGICAIITGTLFMAAGGSWADIAQGISSVPTGILSANNGFGNPGAGGIALFLTLVTFGGKGKRLIWPTLLGISAAVVYASAGGVFLILVNVIRIPINTLTGGA